MVSILQVCTHYEKVGGIETCVRELVAGLKRRCHVEVLSTTKGFRSSAKELDGVPVKYIAGPITVRQRPLAITMPYELGKSKADVLHYHLPFPLAVGSHLLANAVTGISVVSWHADLIGYPRLKRCIEPFLQEFLRRSGAIITSSRRVIEQTPSLYKHADKCHVVPWGIDPARYQTFRPDRVAQLRRAFGTPLVLFTGRLVYYKGLDVLIDAMRRVDAHLAIVGSGHLEHQLRHLVTQLGLEGKVTFLGQLDESDLVDIYQASDVFVLPSTSTAESFGLVQVEAMFCGKPVINTAIDSAVPEVSVHGETGLTVGPNDSQELSEAINLLLGDRELRERLGAQARERALGKFSQDAYVSGVIEVYKKVLDLQEQRETEPMRVFSRV